MNKQYKIKTIWNRCNSANKHRTILATANVDIILKKTKQTGWVFTL